MRKWRNETLTKGILTVVSGPAGSGKGTVVKQIIENKAAVLSVSLTTRAPRPGEENGVHYYFVSEEEFHRMVEAGDVLEYTNYCGNYYGTPRGEVEKILDSGGDVILEIEVDGAVQVKKLYQDAVLIMLIPPDAVSLEKRLRGRGTETDDVVRKRLDRAREELGCLCDYDYVVVNADGASEECADNIASIIKAEKFRRDRMKSVTDKFFE